MAYKIYCVTPVKWLSRLERHPTHQKFAGPTPVRMHTWVTGSIPQWGEYGDASLPPSLPPLSKINDKNILL